MPRKTRKIFPALAVLFTICLALSAAGLSTIHRTSAADLHWEEYVDRILQSSIMDSYFDLRKYPTEMREFSDASIATLNEMADAAIATEDNRKALLLDTLIVWRLQVDIGNLNLKAYKNNREAMGKLISSDEMARRNMQIHVLAWNASELANSVGDRFGTDDSIEMQLAQLVPYGFLALPYAVDRWKSTGNDDYLKYIALLVVSEHSSNRTDTWLEGNASSRSLADVDAFDSKSWVANHTDEIEGYRNFLSRYRIF